MHHLAHSTAAASGQPILLVDSASSPAGQDARACVRTLHIVSRLRILTLRRSKADQKWEFKFDLGVRSLLPEWRLIANPSWESIKRDLLAGITIPTVSIPVSLAAALLSGVPPHWGLISGAPASHTYFTHHLTRALFIRASP